MSDKGGNDKLQGNPFGYGLYILGILAAVFTLLSLLNFMLYLFHVHNFADLPHLTLETLVERGLNYEPWPALHNEIKMYLYHDYWLGWLNWDIFKFIRNATYPFSQFLDLFLLRVFGFLIILLPLVILVGVSICIGRIQAYRRKSEFVAVSATFSHIFIQCRFISYAFITAFLSFPFGDHVPYFGYIPIYSVLSIFGHEFIVWYSDPVILGLLILGPSMFIGYQVAKHAAIEDI